MQTSPESYKAIMALEQYLSDSALQPLHKELIKLRASIINKCAYCIDMHSKDLRQLGETEQRIYLLTAWRETNLYTPEEQALLAITDELTMLQHVGLTDATYTTALQFFDEAYLSHIIMAVATINVWNRVAVATNMGASITTP